ncbi:MAG: ATP-dependent DNA helicase [Candidatus Melainabacteria bacterium]|nr:ATP-dependent DNA helicase [Candidatus Melainabacteria bacterium]
MTAEPIASKQQKASSLNVNDLFDRLAQKMPAYEVRQPQLDMAQSIKYTISAGKTGIFEAGTGIGKSLAALIPAALSGKRVVVSTATISLQEQYIKKDLPLLQEALINDTNKRGLEIAIMKGRGNYVGLRRFHEHLQEQAIDNELVDWINESLTGDLAELDFMPDFETWYEISSSSEDCLRNKCPNFATCFYFGARRQAERADILVVNHSLLLADAASLGGILPKYEVLIVDEAHHLAAIATDTFSTSISNFGIKRLASRALKKVRAPVGLVDHVQADAHDLFDFLARDVRFKKTRMREPVEEAIPLLASLTELKEWLDNQDFEDVLDIDLARDRLKLKAKSLSSTIDKYLHCLGLLREPSLDWVVFVDRQEGARGKVEVAAAPLDVSHYIEDALLSKSGLETSIFMSATLATAGEDPFGFFKSSVGIQGPVVQDQYPSPFDFPRQSILYLPRGLPNPNSGDFLPEACRYIEAILEASSGRAFVLFTSRYALNTAYDTIADRLPFESRRQGDMPRGKLLDWFRSTDNAVLFGTSSFWEGVSVDGEQLSCVIIDRIPFQVPDDPVYEARCEKMKEDEEKNWFADLALPHATTRLKQGVGRLIRTQEDRGMVAILDPRLTEKFYGRKIIQCLPPMRLTHSMEDVKRFFGA